MTLSKAGVTQGTPAEWLVLLLGLRYRFIPAYDTKVKRLLDGYL
ncbi:MAG: hypothetical protein WAW36_15715 [Methylovulum miyakonense]